MVMMMIKTKLEDQVLQRGKEEREKQKPRRSRQRYQKGFCFGTQDTIEGVSDLGSIAVLLRGEFSLLTWLSSATR